MNKTHKKVCRILNYIDRSLIEIPAIMERVSIFAFVFLIVILIAITSSAIG